MSFQYFEEYSEFQGLVKRESNPKVSDVTKQKQTVAQIYESSRILRLKLARQNSMWSSPVNLYICPTWISTKIYSVFHTLYWPAILYPTLLQARYRKIQGSLFLPSIKVISPTPRSGLSLCHFCPSLPLAPYSGPPIPGLDLKNSFPTAFQTIATQSGFNSQLSDLTGCVTSGG